MKFRSLVYYCLYFLICFSTFFLTKLMPISPIYFAILLSSILFFFYTTRRYNDCRASKATLLIGFLSFLYSGYIIIISYAYGCDIKQPILSALGVCLYVLTNIMLPITTWPEVKRVFSSLINIALIVFVAECSYRISHPAILAWDYDKSDFFYMFKYNSIMFHDSNEVGFAILIILCLSMYLRDRFDFRISPIKKMLFVIVLLLTFSRAAILAYFTTQFYFHVYRSSRIKVVGRGIILSIFIVAILYFASLLINTDTSFRSKFEIWNRFFIYFKKMNICQFIFGNGYGKSSEVLGIYAHAHILIQFVEFGQIGISLFFLLLFAIYNTSRKTLYVILPYVVAGISYAPIVIPYFFIALGIISALEKKTVNTKERLQVEALIC